jgi:hypothetical protein
VKTPILLIAFCRIEETKRVFKQIRKAKPEKLYVFNDGPRTEKERINTTEVRSFITSSIDWECQVHTLFNEKNMGVGYGPATAIDWFFRQEEEGIVLEDDCFASDQFFPFCETMLERYRNDSRVSMIQGFNPFPDYDTDDYYFFSKYNLSWGWASWRDRWSDFDIKMRDWPEFNSDKNLRSLFNDFLVRAFWRYNFNNRYREPDKGWDEQLTYAFMAKRRLALVPSKCLVLNIGYETHGATNTRYRIPDHLRCLKLPDKEFLPRFTDLLATNSIYDSKVERVHFRINIVFVARLGLKDFIMRTKVFSPLYPPLRKIAHFFYRLNYLLSK